MDNPGLWLISQTGTDRKADVFLMSTLRGSRFNYPLTRPVTPVRSEPEKIINPDCVGAGADNKKIFGGSGGSISCLSLI